VTVGEHRRQHELGDANVWCVGVAESFSCVDDHLAIGRIEACGWALDPLDGWHRSDRLGELHAVAAEHQLDGDPGGNWLRVLHRFTIDVGDRSRVPQQHVEVVGECRKRIGNAGERRSSDEDGWFRRGH